MKTAGNRNHDIGFGFLSRPERAGKPRQVGITVALDWARSLSDARSFIETVGDLIDHIKLTDHVGIMWRYTERYIRQKNRLYRKAGIDTLPGGVTYEIAAAHGKVPAFMSRVASLGFTGVEVSDSSIDIAPQDRVVAIKLGIENGLHVFTELGKKFPDKPLDPRAVVETALQDLDSGACMVVIEKSDVELVMHHASDTIHHIINSVGKQRIIVECGPGENRFEIAKWLIKEFGADINLENIDAQEVFAIEAMRHGLHRAVNLCYFDPYVNRPASPIKKES